MVEIRDVMHRQMLPNWLSSSTAAYISGEFFPDGSRIDSTLSRHKIIFLEDRNGLKGVRSLGFLTPAPMTLESWLRKWACEAGNWSQRINQQFPPNHSLMQLWWRTVRAIDVFPIPPGPIRAIGARVSTRPMILLISSSRPKHTLGGGGSNSPEGMLCESRTVDPTVFEIVDLAWALGVMRVCLVMDSTSDSLADFHHQSLPKLPSWYNGCQKQQCGCLQHCAEAQKQLYRCLQHPDEHQKQWCGCPQHYGEYRKQLDSCLLQARSGSGQLVMVIQKWRNAR